MRGSTATPVSLTGVGAEQQPLGRLAVALLVAATFGSGMAMIVPMAYSLAVRLEELAPGRPDLLGVLLGVGSAATLVVAPLTGVLSDRTRSRWGRRRPFTVAGLALGVTAVPVLVTAPTVPVLALGWILSTVGWNTAGASIGNWQADRLPAQQRGTVSGLTGLTMQISPVLGILLVGTVRSETLLVFAIPAAVGLLLAGAFALLAADPDSRGPAPADRMTLRRILGSYAFDPRAFPDFTRNWIGRFVFFLGLSLTTSFTVFFFAQRLDLAVPDVAGVLALTSALSIGTALVGSLGGGRLSDRTGVRRPFVVAGAALFAAGSIVSATAGALPALLVGSLLSSLGIALFSAVGQALSLDVLPHRETQAGRYTAITLFAQKIPGVISPLAAPLVLALGGGENFTALYLTAAALALLGGALIGVTVRSPAP
ncbi:MULTISPECIES: MFS transporter [unclassified Rathayibacter]|uniref:MFS transporter n=1 Tax=unclassified Rathayibacter TaxID=2609250 RepID=UPI0010509066|nr:MULTISPECIES: MFS transporter [unclassified Rathayibacter]TCL82652.1 Na+/melibiose symporter-like transporter [Rathayibacter sp. PhB192]TCM27991.1 Na+/melibiose symporter-like transporter [Rathayibacter sp. PhB179]